MTDNIKLPTANYQDVIRGFNWDDAKMDFIDGKMIDTSSANFAIYGLNRNIISDWWVAIGLTSWFVFIFMCWGGFYLWNTLRMDVFWPDQNFADGTSGDE